MCNTFYHKTCGILMLLLLLPLGAMAEDDWWLERVKVENIRYPHWHEAYKEISEGYHLYYEEVNCPDGRSIPHSCTRPPQIIRRNQTVHLTVTDHYYEWVIWAFAYVDGHDPSTDPWIDPTPTPDRICDFNNCPGYCEPFAEDERRPDCDVYLKFTDDIMRDINNRDDRRRMPADGAEFAIVFKTYGGQTRWVYKFHSGGLEEEEEEPTVVIVRTPVSSGGDESEGDEPEGEESEGGESSGGNPDGGYGEISGGGMAGAIGGTVGVAIIVLIGSGGAGGGTGGGGSSGGGRPSDRFVRRDKEGNIICKNPVTGETESYPPGADEEMIRKKIEGELLGGHFREDFEKHNKWVEQDRERVRKEINDRKDEHDKYVKRKEAEEKAFWHKYNQAHKLKGKYLAIDDEGEGDEIYKSLRRSMLQKQGEWSAESWAEQSKADYSDSYLTATKVIKDSADTGMDMAAEYGGEEYKVVRDIYKATAEMTQTMTDAAVRGKSLKRAALVGTLRAGITWLQYRTEGKSHYFATIGGESARDFITALDEGKSFKEAWEAAKAGAKRGTKDGLIDHATGKLTDASKNANGLKHTEGMKGAYGAAADDVGKLGADNFL